MSIVNHLVAGSGQLPHTPASAVTAGDVVRLADGRVGVAATDIAAGALGTVYTAGRFALNKPATHVVLEGTLLWWNLEAKCVSLLPGAGMIRCGVAVADASATDTDVIVDLNVFPVAPIDLLDGHVLTSVVNNGVATLFPGGLVKLAFTTAAEAQKADLYGNDLSISATAGFIWDAILAIFNIGDSAAADINFGVASSTNASDFDSIQKYCAFHLDGNALDIKVQSKDGITTVAATDTTLDAVDDRYSLYQIDARDAANVKMYVDGVLIPAPTSIDFSNGGPLMPIVHIEKTSDDSPGEVRVLMMRARYKTCA